MKKLVIVFFAAFIILTLVGCLASTTSPVGVSCDFSKGLTLINMPLQCQPGS